jgi:hypothetical protein
LIVSMTWRNGLNGQEPARPGSPLRAGRSRCALIEQYRDPAGGAITLTGLATQLDQLRASLQAVAGNVRRHEEHLRKMKRPERAS